MEISEGVEVKVEVPSVFSKFSTFPDTVSVMLVEAVNPIVPLESKVADFSLSFNSKVTLLGVFIVTVELSPFKEVSFTSR